MTDYKQLCRELVWLDQAEPGDYADWRQAWNAAIGRARAALAEPEPQQRCIYSPVQIAECGGPCQQGPEHCDCGELWVTEPEGLADEELDAKWGLPAGTVASWGAKPPSDVAAAISRQLDRDIARAVLARWGNHPVSPDSSTQPS